MTSPVLYLLAGPNGAGKTTFVDDVLHRVTHLPFVNADLIAAARWPGEELERAYEASEAAMIARTTHLDARESFITETVFSHESKVDLVRDAIARGYEVELHVILIPADLAVARVAQRVRRGGHGVPEHKVRERWDRLWPLVADARDTVDRTTVWDNSDVDEPFRRVATYEHGVLRDPPTWPAWAPAAIR